MKNLKNSKALYLGLIITFIMIYVFIGFVSTLHSIEFFRLANKVWLAVMLGVAYETGQISVLFSILMTKSKNLFLPWLLMILMTSLQITANVYASYKFMVANAGTDWQLWKQSILFWLDASDPEMYRVVISWITGALLPVVALGLTALVAQNIQLRDEEPEKPEEPNAQPDFTEEELKEFETAWSDLKNDSQEDEEPKLIEEPKKVEEPLKEEIKVVPQKRKRIPKSKVKTKDIKSTREAKKALAELKKPSKGEELLQSIDKGEIIVPEEEKQQIENDINQISNEKDEIPIVDSSKSDGVEVIDVKAIPKLDKYGIPINPKERKSWDRI